MQKQWTAVLTGDVIKSRKAATLSWQQTLKSALHTIDPKDQWRIFRGDAFQIAVAPGSSLRDAIYIKASLRAGGADVRIAIGLGEAGAGQKDISESTGEAFILSGSRLETLKKDRLNMAVNSPSEDFNEEMNTLLRLALLVMDGWSKTSAAMVKATLEQKNILQNELAVSFGKSQSSVSETLKRARFSEIMELDALFRKKLIKLAK